MSNWKTWALAALLVCEESALADEPVVLSPASDWQLNYADDSCRLARQFGTGESAVAFYIEQFAPSKAFQMVVAGKPFRSIEQNKPVYYQFGPDQPRQESTPLFGSLGSLDPSLIFSSAGLAPAPERGANADWRVSSESLRPTLSPTQERAVVVLGVGGKAQDKVRLALGPIDKAMAALRTCTTELISHWGIDTAAHATLSREVMPTKSPGSWISARDYPTDQLRKGEQGLVYFRLMVDAEGNPTSCKIQRSTRPQNFDDTVCRLLMKRARFQPALAADGRPIASYWQTAVRFEIPG